MTRASIAVVVIGLAGCIEVPGNDLVLDQELTWDGCDWPCGENSPIIDAILFHDLHIGGLPNRQGIRIQSFTKDGRSFSLRVIDGRIYGFDGGVPMISGTGLRNAELTLGGPYGRYSVRIDQVSTTRYWAEASTPRFHETYVLLWNYTDRPGYPWKNLCLHADPNATGEDLLGMNGMTALVFEGEKIDARTKNIDYIDKNWFNIGCPGSALAKLALTAHTGADVAAGFITTVPERQTMLRMFVADYCGGGRPYTVPGEPLGWMDHRLANKYRDLAPPGKYQLEARWTPNGADCLHVPRLKISSLPAADVDFPGGVLAVMGRDGCLPRSCTDLSPTSLGGYHLVSSNPMPR